MTLLLVLSAVLLLISGLVKLRAGERAGLGLTLLPLLETLTGLGLSVPVIFGWRPGPGLGLGIVVGTVVFVVGSSVRVGTLIARRRRTRKASEAARLQTYVRYLSRQDPPAPPGT